MNVSIDDVPARRPLASVNTFALAWSLRSRFFGGYFVYLWQELGWLEYLVT